MPGAVSGCLRESAVLLWIMITNLVHYKDVPKKQKTKNRGKIMIYVLASYPATSIYDSDTKYKLLLLNANR